MLYSIPPTVLFSEFVVPMWLVSNSSTSIICRLNGTIPSEVYLFTKRIPPSTFLRTTAIRSISVNDWVPVTSQFLDLHQRFQSCSSSVFSSSFPVCACRVKPLPTTFRLYAPSTPDIKSEFLSRSRALALTVSRLWRSVTSADQFCGHQLALSR